MAINCLDDLFKLGWKRGIGHRGYTRPSGKVVLRRNQLTEMEKSEIGDILFPGLRGRRKVDYSVTVSDGDELMTEPSSYDSPAPPTSSSSGCPPLPSTTPSHCFSSSSSASTSSTTGVFLESNSQSTKSSLEVGGNMIKIRFPHLKKSILTDICMLGSSSSPTHE